MTKREYAEEIVKIMESHSDQKYRVVEVEKTNGVIKTGILPNITNGAAPTVYVDDWYNGNKSIDEVATEIERVINMNKRDDFDASIFADYEKMKGNLRARLYNKKTYAEVFRSARGKGFDDLIIVPYATIPEMSGSNGIAGFKITNAILDRWGVTKKEVIDTALKNSEKEVVISSMYDVFVEMGMPEDEARMRAGSAPMTIVTNTTKVNGAISILFAKKEMKERFPNGFVVLPSSIHEVIVVPMETGNEDYSNMVKEVNSTEVSLEEQLSNRAYTFVA